MRKVLTADGAAIQQSMVGAQGAYGTLDCNQLHVGVVLELHQADSAQNRSAWQVSDRRGVQHEATVLIVNDGTGATTLLKNVIICPQGPSGIDNYTEHLPRPATKTLTGDPFDTQLHRIDPMSLDGDYVLVGYIGGSMTQPIILGWFPHPRNTYDPATSGVGNPNSSGQGTTLPQKRYFQRIYGVEYLVSSQGDVYVSTQLAGGVVDFEADPVDGRYARNVPDVGGAIYLDVKPGQIVELNFNPIVHGTNTFGWDDDLVQTNPRPNGQPATRETEKTRIHVDDAVFSVDTPTSVELRTETLSVEAPTTTFDSDDFTVDTTNSCAIIGSNINLGDANATPQDTLLRSRFATDASLLSALASAASAAATASNSPNPANNAAAASALSAALAALVAALSGSQTTNTKAT